MAAAEHLQPLCYRGEPQVNGAFSARVLGVLCTHPPPLCIYSLIYLFLLLMQKTLQKQPAQGKMAGAGVPRCSWLEGSARSLPAGGRCLPQPQPSTGGLGAPRAVSVGVRGQRRGSPCRRRAP